MSSHHFVKEQQEPAVVILNTDSVRFEQVAPLLEWVPTVLVWQNCLDDVLSWGVKIDVILAEEEFQRKNLQLLEEQYPIRFLSTTPQNVVSDSLHYLKASSHSAAHLVGFQHTEVSQLESFLDWMDLTLLEGNWRFYPVKSRHFKKWFPESTIEIYGEEKLPLEIENSNGKLLFPLHYATLLDVPEGITEIQAPKLFWIGEKV